MPNYSNFAPKILAAVAVYDGYDLVVHTTCQYKKFYSIVLRRGGETKKTAPIFETIYASHRELFYFP